MLLFSSSEHLMLINANTELQEQFSTFSCWLVIRGSFFCDSAYNSFVFVWVLPGLRLQILQVFWKSNPSRCPCRLKLWVASQQQWGTDQSSCLHTQWFLVSIEWETIPEIALWETSECESTVYRAQLGMYSFSRTALLDLTKGQWSPILGLQE